jgi:hypothetical protein
MNEYIPGHITNYLEFHFSGYSDKQGFLKFLRYELYNRLNRKIDRERRRKLQFAQEWVLEKQQELKSAQKVAVQPTRN